MRNNLNFKPEILFYFDFCLNTEKVFFKLLSLLLSFTMGSLMKEDGVYCSSWVYVKHPAHFYDLTSV